MLKIKKIALAMILAIPTMGLLFGCGTNNDEQEPDPTEEPSEQQSDENEMGEEQNQ